MKNRFKKSGFTLMELLVVMGIFTVLTGASLNFLCSGRLSVDTNEARIQAIQCARRAMEQVKKELRLSQAGKVHIYDDFITRSTSAGGDPIAGPVAYFQLPAGIYEDTLIPYLTADNSLQWGSEDRQVYNIDGYVYYYLDPNSMRLCRAICDDEGEGIYGDRKTITTNISLVSFSRENETSDLINIEIAGQARINSGVTITHILRSSVRLRN